VKREITKTEHEFTTSIDRRDILKYIIGGLPIISLAVNAQAKDKSGIVLPDNLKITSGGIFLGPVLDTDVSLSGYSDLTFSKNPLKGGANDGTYFFNLAAANNFAKPATILKDNMQAQALNISFKLVPQFTTADISSIDFSYLTQYNLPGTPSVGYSSYTKKGDSTVEVALSSIDIAFRFKSGEVQYAKKGQATFTQVTNSDGLTLTLDFKHVTGIDIDYSFRISLLALAGGAMSNKPQSSPDR